MTTQIEMLEETIVTEVEATDTQPTAEEVETKRVAAAAKAKRVEAVLRFDKDWGATGPEENTKGESLREWAERCV